MPGPLRTPWADLGEVEKREALNQGGERRMLAQQLVPDVKIVGRKLSSYGQTRKQYPYERKAEPNVVETYRQLPSHRFR